MAHRFAYEYCMGAIPEGLQLDHLCRNTFCVRPEHLEPVSGKINLLRGNTINAANARKTHCIRGHPYSGDNLYIYEKTGARACKECMRIHYREYRAAKCR